MFIDSHCHLDFAAYKDDVVDVISRARQAGVKMINIGTKQSTSQTALAQAKQYPEDIWAVIGVHPIHLVDDIEEKSDFGADGGYTFTTKKEVFDEDFYRQLATDEKVVGFGETGLDYYHLPKGQTVPAVKAIQEKVFRAFIGLALETDKALVMHCRGSKKNPNDAYDDMIAILREEKEKRGGLPRGVIHCFGGTLAHAQAFTALGFCIGFTGIITFKNAESLRDVACALPLEKILIETDAPFLAPDPQRGKRNEPAYVALVAEKIAEIRGLPLSTVAETTTATAKTVFKIS